ncbi:hypothetical protein EJB05_22157, partial [Eragrostis curvula]
MCPLSIGQKMIRILVREINGKGIGKDFIGSSRMALFGSSGVYRSWIDAPVSESSKDYIARKSTLEDRRMNYVYKEIKWISVRNVVVLSRSSTSSQLPVG